MKSDFRQQHQSLLQFKGTLSLLKPSMDEDEKVAVLKKHWEPHILEMMQYWFMVALDTSLVVYEPVPFAKGGSVFREDPPLTPMELVELLPDMTMQETCDALAMLEGHMYRIAYEILRVILTRDLSKYHADMPLALRVLEEL